MVQVRKNIVVQGISGGIEGLVFRQMPDGRTYVSRKPDFSRRKFSRGQREHQGRFQKASAYAREAAKRHPIYAELAKGTVKSPYNVALSDWFHAPVIDAIERSGGVIRVQARDNVMVAKVEIAILDEAGSALVTGLASQSGEDVWEFASDAEGRVLVKAWDLAGNVTEGSL